MFEIESRGARRRRLEKLQADIAVLEFECQIGVDDEWVLTYTRPRHGIAVYRGRTSGRWLVRDSSGSYPVADVREARLLSQSLIGVANRPST